MRKAQTSSSQSSSSATSSSSADSSSSAEEMRLDGRGASSDEDGSEHAGVSDDAALAAGEAADSEAAGQTSGDDEDDARDVDDADSEDPSDHDDSTGLDVLSKRQKLLQAQLPIRLPPRTVGSEATRKNKGRLGKGKLLHFAQAIGGVICNDCGTSWSKRWASVLLEAEPVPLCSACANHRQNRRSKRPAAVVRNSERRRLRELLYSQHSSWGSLDLMKADPRLISGQHPLAHAPEHLLCTPLSLEQAVCLSSLHVGGRNTGSKELHKTASAAFDILDQQDPDFAQLHTRNLVILVRHDLLRGDYATAADTVSVLMRERRLIPDVVFKACMQVLRCRRCSATAPPDSGQLTALQRLIRSMIKHKLAPHPRDVHVHQEMVGAWLCEGQVKQALEFLQEVVEQGRPYFGHVRYHAAAGVLMFLSLCQNLAAAQPVHGGGGGEGEEEDMEEASGARGAGSGDAWMEVGGGEGAGRGEAARLERRGRLLQPRASASRQGDKAGVGASIVECVALGRQLIAGRKGVGAQDDNKRAVRELQRALAAERAGAPEARSEGLGALRSDALSAHLVKAHCVAGQWLLAAEELMAHVRAQPLAVNGWRRLAEFRNILDPCPLPVLLGDVAASPVFGAQHFGGGSGAAGGGGAEAGFLQSQAATQPMEGIVEGDVSRSDGEGSSPPASLTHSYTHTLTLTHTLSLPPSLPPSLRLSLSLSLFLSDATYHHQRVRF